MNQFSLSGCDYLIFSGDSEDENCHLVSGTFTFQVCKSSKNKVVLFSAAKNDILARIAESSSN